MFGMINLTESMPTGRYGFGYVFVKGQIRV